ncbi:hypothetical protein C1646_810023 [Rhizophagus diaphanus]|nr:hypothetical protein C1646_810023 [Rhizophagus diaphanus] [Rhizophagus sp. MUCL 43196]
MNSQQNSLQRKKIIILLLMQKVFKKKNRIFNANTHLLTFTQVTSKCSFSIFTHLNLRASQQKRPKTERFWVDVFPYLTDESGYNSFQKNFHITRATFNAIAARLESHPGFA